MSERPLHRLDCRCRVCRPPVEPTARQLLVVAVMLLIAVGLMLWRA